MRMRPFISLFFHFGQYMYIRSKQNNLLKLKSVVNRFILKINLNVLESSVSFTPIYTFYYLYKVSVAETTLIDHVGESTSVWGNRRVEETTCRQNDRFSI